MNEEILKCPECGEIENIKLLNTYKIAGTVVGGGTGFAVGFLAAKEGAKTGVAIGAGIGRCIPIIGVIGGTAIGGLGGAITGMITGATIGSVAGAAIDEMVVGEYQCGNEKCSTMFKFKRKVDVV